MPAGQIQDQIADEFLQQFDIPLSVSAMKKLRQFPMLQELGFNGQLGFSKETFHGLKDWYKQMDLYSNSNLILKIAWKIIKSIAGQNPLVEALLFTSKSMGKVGNLFKSIHNFDKVFAVNKDDVLDPDKLIEKITNVV